MLQQKYTIKAQLEEIKYELKEIYPDREIKTIANILFEKYLQISPVDIHIRLNEVIPDHVVTKFNNAIIRLKNHEPVQYIVGETEFYGLKFKVNSSVLVPRPETEELVKWIIDDNVLSDPYVLDIGTGSGCIAVSLAFNITRATVSAIEISNEALQLAKQNAKNNSVNVEFINDDILNPAYNYKEYDVIISNPPYVLEKDIGILGKNVIDHEPHLALFVGDSNPLVFYERISQFSQRYLKKNGKIYFEVNEEYGNDVRFILEKFNFKDIILKKDLNGKDRMIMGKK